MGSVIGGECGVMWSVIGGEWCHLVCDWSRLKLWGV